MPIGDPVVANSNPTSASQDTCELMSAVTRLRTRSMRVAR
jgi:hypothetical protein